MVTKKDFFQYMSSLYDEEYSDDDSYKTLKSILKVKDKDSIKELENITQLSPKDRLRYRYALAANGKELTPRQVDQYISVVQYALSNMDTDE
jgi:hypothetical protein